MELFKAEAAAIRSRIEEWLTHDDYELEASFLGGEVDSTTFMAVAQRLRAKGYTALPQEDHLNVITPEHVRFTLSSLSTIQQYCADDVMAGKAFTAMLKNRATAESQVDLEDYDTVIKVRRESPMAQDDAKLREMFAGWDQARKAFRMIRRWSFEKGGLRIDMSIVRSTKKERNGNYRWQRRFRDQDVMRAAPTYEIEVELLHKAGDTVETAERRLISGVGEVLRGIQNHSVLIRNSTKAKVLAAYKELTGTDRFRGPSLRVLKKANFMREQEPGKPNIRNGYNVTDKADGLRTLGFVDGKGDLYLIDMGMKVYRTGLRRPELRLSLVDGEWVTQTKDDPPKPMQQFLLFDVFYMPDKKDVSKYPFQPGALPIPSVPAREEGGAAAADAAAEPPPPENSRHNQLLAWAATWNKDAGATAVAPGITPETRLQVAAKKYSFARAGDTSIFKLAARVLGAARQYYTDGLIFTPNADPLPSKPADTFHAQFKWKPPQDNTIDFLVRVKKRAGSKTQDDLIVGEKPGTGQTVTYKTLYLYVGSTAENPRDIILNKQPLPKPDYGEERQGRQKYRGVLFVPKEFPDPKAAICNLEAHLDPDTGEMYIQTEETKEPILDRTIVEMAYDPSEPPEWRWKPIRVRTDKTERYQRGKIERTLNAEKVADDTWDSIYDPVTVSMITTGAEQPLESEIEALGKESRERALMARRYFERPDMVKDQNVADGLKKFHTRWIKEQILYRAGLSGEGKQLLDLACGVAGDIHIWRRLGTKFVFGLDNASKNILGTDDSAYKRYMGVAQDAGGLDMVAPMLFAIADTSLPLVTGEAGKTDQEKDILRTVFGRMRALKPEEVPPYVTEIGNARLRTGADCVACMFAIHYFFESAEKLRGLLRNVADTLKVGGYFVGCCFDGEKVFELLRGLEKGAAKTGMEKGSILWKITRQYEEEDLPAGDAGFGIPIDVHFATIGMEHREYLVPFKLLEEKMRLIGCELVTEPKELQALGLAQSTATFDVSYEMATTRGGQKFPMGEAAKQFSFLNRWFVFKRTKEETIAEAAAAEAEAAIASRRLAGNEAVAAAAAGEGNGGRAATARARAAAAARAANALGNGDVPAPPGDALGEALNAAVEAAGTAAGAAGLARTVPVAPGSSLPAGRTYAPEEILLIHSDAASKDVLGIKDPGAPRWLIPGAPFPIEDPMDREKVYPSIEHFLGGMAVKLASNKTEGGPAEASTLAASIFGREGTIHKKFTSDRLVETAGGTTALNAKRDRELLKAEIAAVKDAMRPESLKKKYGIVIDAAQWAVKREEALREGYRQRWKRDARFRRILEAARAKGLTPLYYTPGANMSNLGGILRRGDGRIEGDNKIGQILMDIAGYPK